MNELVLFCLFSFAILTPSYGISCDTGISVTPGIAISGLNPITNEQCALGQNACLQGIGRINVFGLVEENITVYSCANNTICNSTCEDIVSLIDSRYGHPLLLTGGATLLNCRTVCCEENNCNRNPIDQISPFGRTLSTSSVQTATTPTITIIDEDQNNCGVSNFTTCYGERIDCSGDFSDCYGDDNHCSGDFSDCYGERSNCSGDYNECYGDGGECSGDYSTCYGNNKNCTGSYSTCFGDNINCTGDYSKCYGNNINCHGQFSNCYGNNVNCYGDFSSCNGNRVSCSGRFSDCP